jgi:hypothetical protein
MLYREIIAVCSEIHIKHANTLCGQNVGNFIIKLGDAYSAEQSRARFVVGEGDSGSGGRAYCGW